MGYPPGSLAFFLACVTEEKFILTDYDAGQFSSAKKPSKRLKIKFYIHHFYIDHNAPCLPPTFYIIIVFDFSWDDHNTQEKLETIVSQNYGG